MNINLIIFDFDGVIIDSGADIANAVNYTLKHFKRPELPKEEIVSYVGRGAENLIRRSFKDCDEEIVKKALPFYKDYYLKNCVIDTVLYDNVADTLEYFKNKKIGLVTNKPELLTLEILDRLQIRKYFKCIIGPESVKYMKPDPEGIYKVMETLGEKPEKTIMIGDSYTDIEAGKSAYTFTCGVTYGLGDIIQLTAAQPDLLIDNIIRLTELIR